MLAQHPRSGAGWRALAAAESAVLFAALGALLFGAAGTVDWPGAWAWLAIVCVASAVALTVLDVDLIKERITAPTRRRLRTWDAAWASVLAAFGLGWFVLMALDAVRFRWLVLPGWTQAAGAVVLVGSHTVGLLALVAHPYASPVVAVQSDRDHSVVSTGAYAIVRHPMYAGVLWFFPGTAMLLGSGYGLALSPLMIALVVVRTALEDRMLQAELPGYREYAREVRYRLIPGIW